LNKYKRLLKNVLTFAIGTFSSKILVFLLVPLYTAALTKDQYGVTDLIVQTGNLLMPLVSVGMSSAIIRFGLDKSYRKETVFSTGVFATLAGFALLLLLWPALSAISLFDGYTFLIYIFVIMSALRSLCMHFVRSLNKVKLFTFDGVQSTFLTLLFNILFLLVFHWGIEGYVMATVAADFCSILFLTFTAKLWRYLRFSALDKSISKMMLKYSAPLIPTSLFWWIVNVSDRYMVAYSLGSGENGLYAIAYKIPTIISLISNIFIEAWQMSAVMEKDNSNRNEFFSRVFNALAALLFISSSFLIPTCRVINDILVADSYHDSWKYIPLLIIATMFCCFANFLNSVYMIERKSVMTLMTVVTGAITNVVLNAVLIPIFGVNGAAFATLTSYAVVFVLRAKTSRKYVRIHFLPLRFMTNTFLVFVQSLLMIFGVSGLVQLPLMVLVLLINCKTLFRAAKRILASRKTSPAANA